MCDVFICFERHVITLIVEGLKRNISNNFAGCNFHHFVFKNIIIIVKIYFMIFSKIYIYIFFDQIPFNPSKKHFPVFKNLFALATSRGSVNREPNFLLSFLHLDYSQIVQSGVS